METDSAAGSDDNRERIIAAASRLLAEHGVQGVSTRAVCAAAGIQGPTIYRLFGDKQGLLDAVAARGCEEYLAIRASAKPVDDPVEDLRSGWDQHVSFGLAHPALYSLIYGTPRPGAPSSAAAVVTAPLAERIHRIAEAGRLRMSESRAAQLVYAAGCGTVLTLLGTPEGGRDLGLSDTAREAVITAITTRKPPGNEPRQKEPGPVSAAVSLRAVLPLTPALSTRERALLGDWLDRIATSSP